MVGSQAAAGAGGRASCSRRRRQPVGAPRGRSFGPPGRSRVRSRRPRSAVRQERQLVQRLEGDPRAIGAGDSEQDQPSAGVDPCGKRPGADHRHGKDDRADVGQDQHDPDPEATRPAQRLASVESGRTTGDLPLCCLKVNLLPSSRASSQPTTSASTVLVRSPLRRLWSVSDLEDSRAATGSPNIGIVIPATLRLADDDNLLVAFVTSGQCPKR
jgi:hypothetical protein